MAAEHKNNFIITPEEIEKIQNFINESRQIKFPARDSNGNIIPELQTDQFSYVAKRTNGDKTSYVVVPFKDEFILKLCQELGLKAEHLAAQLAFFTQRFTGAEKDSNLLKEYWEKPTSIIKTEFSAKYPQLKDFIDPLVEKHEDGKDVKLRETLALLGMNFTAFAQCKEDQFNLKPLEKELLEKKGIELTKEETNVLTKINKTKSLLIERGALETPDSIGALGGFAAAQYILEAKDKYGLLKNLPTNAFEMILQATLKREGVEELTEAHVTDKKFIATLMKAVDTTLKTTIANFPDITFSTWPFDSKAMRLLNPSFAGVMSEEKVNNSDITGVNFCGTASSFCTRIEVEEELLDQIYKQFRMGAKAVGQIDKQLSKKPNLSEDEKEVRGIKLVPLLEALLSSTLKDRTSQDQQATKERYKYGHEYLVQIDEAAELLGNDPKQVKELGQALQKLAFARFNGEQVLDIQEYINFLTPEKKELFKAFQEGLDKGLEETKQIQSRQQDKQPDPKLAKAGITSPAKTIRVSVV